MDMLETNTEKNIKKRLLYPILIIDDDIELLNSLELVLLSLGFDNIRSFSDSRKVLDAVTKEKPCLVLLDIVMPFITGEDLLKSMKLRFPELPVIIITGSIAVIEREKWKELGVFDLLMKPVKKKSLFHAVISALKNANNEKESP